MRHIHHMAKEKNGPSPLEEQRCRWNDNSRCTYPRSEMNMTFFGGKWCKNWSSPMTLVKFSAVASWVICKQLRHRGDQSDPDPNQVLSPRSGLFTPSHHRLQRRLSPKKLLRITSGSHLNRFVDDRPIWVQRSHQSCGVLVLDLPMAFGLSTTGTSTGWGATPRFGSLSSGPLKASWDGQTKPWISGFFQREGVWPIPSWDWDSGDSLWVKSDLFEGTIRNYRLWLWMSMVKSRFFFGRRGIMIEISSLKSEYNDCSWLHRI